MTVMAEPTFKTYAARRRIKVAPDTWREPDQLLPEAVTYFRLDSWLHTGMIKEVQATEAEIRAAIEEHGLADLEDEILAKTGVTADLTGPHFTPRGMKAPAAPAPAFRPYMREWALGLDPGPLLGPIPRGPREVKPVKVAHTPDPERVERAKKAAATRKANQAAKAAKAK
jgi:hypothetical protein